MRGDLIETFKIVNGFTDYGRDWFTLSSHTNHLILRSNFPLVNFFANRVVKYYNRLLVHVRNASSVTTFKKHLDKFCNVNFHNSWSVLGTLIQNFLAHLDIIYLSCLILIIDFFVLKLLQYLPFHWFYYLGIGPYMDGI